MKIGDMSLIDHDNFEEFRDPETYDLECDAFADDIPAITQWAAKLGGPNLDLACGTGRMSLALAAQGFQVTGVDVVPEMMDRARQKAAAQTLAVEWVVADARSFRLNRQFPFIFMIMNAFQFLLRRPDHEALFGRVREHLTPDGCFLFETRNPTPRNLYEVRHPDPQIYPLPGGGRMVVTEQQHYDPLTQLQHYVAPHTWTFPDGTRREKTNRTALRYVFPQEMESLLHYNGLEIREVWGNWQQEPLTADSRSMIYLCQKYRS